MSTFSTRNQESMQFNLADIHFIVITFTLLVLVKLFPKANRRFLFLGMSLFMIALFFGTRIYFNATYQLTSLVDWNQSLRKVTIYRLDAIYYGFVLYYLYSRNCIAEKMNSILFVFLHKKSPHQ